MSNLQYVRAGACTKGQAKNSKLIMCALEATDCPSNAFFQPASELAKALGAEAAVCLQAKATNQVLNSLCNNGASASVTTGSCLVENFNAEDEYFCTLSSKGCAPGDLYLTSAETRADAFTTCRLCGLTSSSDYDLSSPPSNFVNRFVGDDPEDQLEAVGIAGIVIGVLAGVALAFCVGRMCRGRCSGSSRKTAERSSDDKSSSTDDGDISDSKDPALQKEEEAPETPGIV